MTSRLALAAATALAVVAGAAAAARVDDAGDPLPDGAIARLGTLRQASYSTYDACFSPDGKTIHTISALRSLHCVWDGATGALLQNHPLAPARGLEYFSPDLSVYAVEGAPGRLRVVETRTGKTLSEMVLPPGAFPHVLAFSPDGRRFALSGVQPPVPVEAGQVSPPANHFLAVWDIDAADPRLIEGLPGQVNAASFSADGKRLTAVCWTGEPPAGAGEVSCWDLAAGRLLWRTRLKGGQFATTLTSPDGRTQAVQAGDPNGGHRVELWDLLRGRPLPGWTAPTGTNIELKAFSADGRLLLYLDMGGLHGVEVPIGKERYTLPVNHGPGVLAPDGRSLVTAYPILQRWETATGNPLWARVPVRGHDRPVTGLGFSPDRKRLASVDNDGRLFVWDLETRKPKHLPGRFDGPVAFSPDGRTLFAAVQATSTNVPVIAVDPDTGAVTAGLSTARLFDGPWDPRASGLMPGADGRLTATMDLWEDDLSQGRTEVTWDAKTGKVVRKTALVPYSPEGEGKPREHPYAPLPGGGSEVVLRPDRLVVRDVATGKERFSRPAPKLDGPWTGVVLSGDGKLAATTHPLGTILLWDLSGATGKSPAPRRGAPQGGGRTKTRRNNGPVLVLVPEGLLRIVQPFRAG